jgi:hypothetical protein
MNLLEPGDEYSAFMSALAEELWATPDEETAHRHAAAAAATARTGATGWSPVGVRWVAAVTAFITLLGTGGVAAAGGLADTIQTVIADTARAFPIPVDVPYPTASSRPRPVSDGSLIEHPALPESDSSSRPEEPEIAVKAKDTNNARSPSSGMSESESVSLGEEREHDGDQEDSRHGEWQPNDDPERRSDGDREHSRGSDRERHDDRGESGSDQQEDRTDHHSSDDSSSGGGRRDDR